MAGESAQQAEMAAVSDEMEPGDQRIESEASRSKTSSREGSVRGGGLADALSLKPASSDPWRAFRTLLAVAALLCGSVGLTISTIKAPIEWKPPPDASPFGYTVSLVLFLGPIAVLVWWFARHREVPFSRRAFGWTVAILAPLGFTLDVLLASTLLEFDSPGSTVAQMIPVLGGEVPVEEFIFYFTGFIAVLLTYIWADEHWLALYNVPDYSPAAARVKRILRFDWRAVPAAAAVMGLATLWSWVWGTGNLPIYLYFLTLAALLPTLGLLHSTIHFINWRAFGFALFGILLVSLTWEVTLAIPYRWWGYREEWMIGTIEAWWNLPVEAVVVWLVVTYTTVVTYEAIKIWLASGKSARGAWLGE